MVVLTVMRVQEISWKRGGGCMGLWGGGGREGLEEVRNNADINSFQISRVVHAKCQSILYTGFRKLI